jgi:RNA polymerase sigma factor (sigma-70 family)
MVRMNQARSVLGSASAASESFEEFFRSEHAKLLRALYVVTGDRYFAEDAMQDAFVALWERWEQVRRLEDPSGYLYRTALNRVRRNHRRLTRFMAAVVRMVPREQLYQVEDHDAVIRALGTLTHRQRAAPVLSEMLSFDSETAGRLLGVKAVTARRLASMGRTALRAALEGYDG